jgi:conjugative transfer pilus assembly protein TraH
MKNIWKVTVASLTALAIGSTGAAGLSGVLDGMFANVTAPDVVSNQFRGTISGGGIYARSPISSIQVMSIDPPRLSLGCGGIDLYLGAFSFISAEKLTQFMRNIAQNAAPLAFKMALDASFPQLGGILREFQDMAQKMNDSMRNSCQMARGLLSGVENKEDLEKNLTGSVTAGLESVKGWASDFTDAYSRIQTSFSESAKKARETKNLDGTQVIPKFGNVTWNALNVQKNKGYQLSITDDAQVAQGLLMSLMGTELNKEGATYDADPIHLSYASSKVRLKYLFRPVVGSTGIKEVPIWSCGLDVQDCLTPVLSTFKTTGIEGFVRSKMYGPTLSDGTEPATPQPGSIISNMTACTVDRCGMTTSQLNFLNAMGKIPAIGMMMRAQAVPSVISAIAPELVEAMVDEISIIYGRAVLDTAVTVYSNTGLPKPEDFSGTVRNMMDDIREVEMATKGNLVRLNQMALFIDSAIRANGAVLRYRPH